VRIVTLRLSSVWARAGRAPLIAAASALLGGAVLAGITPAHPSGAQPATAPAYHDYVALGDSYTADVLSGPLPPTTEFVPMGCAQSSADYPHQVAQLLHVAQFHDSSCGGATTADMTQSQSVPLGGTAPPQFAALNPSVDLVTLGIGGNDVGFVSDAESCLNLVPIPIPGAPEGLGGSCAARLTAGGVDQIDEAIKATAPKIATVLQAIRQRAPGARILLVNYLDAVPLDGTGCWSPDVPVQNEDMAYLAAKFVEMDQMLASTAAIEHVQLADTFTPTIGHDVCQLPTVRDVEGVLPLSLHPPDLNFPMHPNGAGARAQTAAVSAAIEGGS
jgi:lysophospholipase L1-like esterase